MSSARQPARQSAAVTRRRFLAHLGTVSSGGVALVTAPGLNAAGDTGHRSSLADVLVVGGGTAGTIAAIQAARLGARTVLVEAASQLGGTTTTAGVDFPGLFHAWGRQIIAGIGWELVTATVKLNGDHLPDFAVPTGPQHWRHQVRLCGALYAVLAEEACLRAGVELRYYESPLSIVSIRDGWKARVAGKGTQVEIRARQVVDATGNAAVVGLLDLPRRREAATQPGTLIYRLAGYRVEDGKIELFNARAAEAVAAGRLLPTDFNRNLRHFLETGGENAMHVPEADSSTSEAHTHTNVRGRQSLLRMMRFLKSLEGFENLRIERLQPETGVRETYRIVGEATISCEDYVSGRQYVDAVAHTFYPIDLHDEHGVRPRHLREGVVPTLPLGALIPKGSRNLIVAGRCVSSDRLANSALRVQASCMAMGQAAGAAAALAASGRTTPARLPLEKLRRALADHAAIVPAG